MPYIEHPLGKTYYRKNSVRNNKAPLIVLHGGPGANHLFLSPMLRSIQDRKIFMYDQLGAGKSTKTPKAKWNIPTFVNELDYLIKAWELNEFHLMGASWGTTLALEYYLRKKGKGVLSLLFQSPMFSAHLWRKDGNRLIKKLPKKYREIISICQKIGATDSKVYKDAEAEYFKRYVCRKPLGNTAFLKDAFKQVNEELYLYMWGETEFYPTGTLKNYNRIDDLLKVKVPSLIFCGEYDEATPETCKKFQKKIAGCELKVIKGCSHIISYEKPKVYMKTVSQFLNKLD